MAPINFRTKLKTFILFPTFLILFGILILFIIATVAIPNGKQLATKLYKLFGWMGLKMVGINLTVSGLEKIDKNKSYVVVGNHPSTLDIFTHIYGLPISIRFLTKSELFRIPIFSRVLKILGLPRIDRDSTSLDLNKINDSIQSVINDGNSIMVFPEGKRSNQKKLLPFKKGAAHIAKDFNLPILPIVSHNAHNLMIKGKVWFISGDIHLDVLDPVESSDDLDIDKVTELLFERIDQALTVDK
jgi:1-acyl-sn-glycerol-3-phosphate acyltransferase|tara:strand:+ start:1504 stop:2232 length:729 start_codon:yes stop_codon:yes gene_type:complete